MARVGMTEKQARQVYGSNFKTIEHYGNNVDGSTFLGATREFCQLLVHRNGKIIGCTLIGSSALESISMVGTYMKHKIKLNSLAIRGLIDREFDRTVFGETNILQQTLFKFNYQKMQTQPRLLNWLENWYDFRRSWCK